MFSSKWALYLWFLQCVPQLINCQKNKFFRKDYKFIEATNSFYKFHTLRQTYEEAKKKCEREGATLFYAIDEEEARVVLDYWTEIQPQINIIYVGISAPFVEQVFETVDGIPIIDVYDKWGPGEPDGAKDEDCVGLRVRGTLHDIPCNRHHQYICKKSLENLEWNNLCDSPDTDYIFANNLGRCYKFHYTPMNWTEAYSVCSAEQSYLAIINSNTEADYLVELTSTAQKDQVIGNFSRELVHLGFLNRNGWNTIKGYSVADSGYSEWDNGQPDGGDKELCGSMSYKGKLNDNDCKNKSFFICEHEIDALKFGFVTRSLEIK